MIRDRVARTADVSFEASNACIDLKGNLLS